MSSTVQRKYQSPLFKWYEYHTNRDWRSKLGHWRAQLPSVVSIDWDLYTRLRILWRQSNIVVLGWILNCYVSEIEMPDKSKLSFDEEWQQVAWLEQAFERKLAWLSLLWLLDSRRHTYKSCTLCVREFPTLVPEHT